MKLNQTIKERNEKIFVLTTKKIKELLKDKNITNYFIDTTYKILPKNKRYYKLLKI